MRRVALSPDEDFRLAMSTLNFPSSMKSGWDLIRTEFSSVDEMYTTGWLAQFETVDGRYLEKEYLVRFIYNLLCRPSISHIEIRYNIRDTEPSNIRIEELYKRYFCEMHISSKSLAFLCLFLYGKKTVSVKSTHGYLERFLAEMGCEITCTNDKVPKFSRFNRKDVDLPESLVGIIDAQGFRKAVQERVQFLLTPAHNIFPEHRFHTVEDTCNYVWVVVEYKLERWKEDPDYTEDRYASIREYVMELTRMYFHEFYRPSEDILDTLIKEYVRNMSESNPQIFPNSYPWEVEFIATTTPDQMNADVYLFAGNLRFDSDCHYDPDFQKKYEAQIRSLINKVNETGLALYIVIYGKYDLFGNQYSIDTNVRTSVEFEHEISTHMLTRQIVCVDDLKNYENYDIDFKRNSTCRIYEVRPM